MRVIFKILKVQSFSGKIKNIFVVLVVNFSRDFLTIPHLDAKVPKCCKLKSTILSTITRGLKSHFKKLIHPV